MPGVFLCATLARVIHPTYLEQDMKDTTSFIDNGVEGIRTGGLNDGFGEG